MVIPECDRALSRLLDTLCTAEREYSRDSFVLVIPLRADEQIVVARGGKPQEINERDPALKEMLTALLLAALLQRGEVTG